jgi:uncharacterized membrane protein YciS (DUF1049 family)
MTTLLYLAVLAFFLGLFAVGTANDAEVTVRFLGRSLGPMTIGSALAGAAIAGVAFASLLGFLDGIKIRLANRQLRRQIRRAEEEADALRLRLARSHVAAPSGGTHEGSRPSSGPEARSF